MCCENVIYTVVELNLRVYPHRAKTKAKATSLGRTTLMRIGIPRPSESESDIAFLIAYGPIGAKAKIAFARCGYSLRRKMLLKTKGS